MDHYDAFARYHYKKPPPYPRPWDAIPEKHGNAAMSVEEMRRVLDQHRGATSLKRDARGRLRNTQGRFVSEGGEVLRG